MYLPKPINDTESQKIMKQQEDSGIHKFKIIQVSENRKIHALRHSDGTVSGFIPDAVTEHTIIVERWDGEKLAFPVTDVVFDFLVCEPEDAFFKEYFK